MESTATDVQEILNDLVLINNDRIAGYQKAIDELKSRDDDGAADSDLIALFERMTGESREIRNELGKEVQVAGGEMAEGTMASGKIYRVWMDIRALFSGKDRHSILASCETGEDAAQKAYRSALEEEGLPSFLREMISSQQQTLKASHDEIRTLRDQAA